MSKPRIGYVAPAKVEDAAMRAEFDRCAREGTPRPESQAIRAHVPAVFWSFANSWRDVFKNGVADHGIKELCRIYVSRSVLCEFCGNQRSIKAAKQGIDCGAKTGGRTEAAVGLPTPTGGYAVAPAEGGTHNHRLWNMGPRLRGDDGEQRKNAPNVTPARSRAGMRAAARRPSS